MHRLNRAHGSRVLKTRAKILGYGLLAAVAIASAGGLAFSQGWIGGGGDNNNDNDNNGNNGNTNNDNSSGEQTGDATGDAAGQDDESATSNPNEPLFTGGDTGADTDPSGDDSSAETGLDYSNMSDDEIINQLLDDERFIDTNDDGVDDRLAALRNIDDNARANLNTFVINEQSFDDPEGRAIDQLTAAFNGVNTDAADDDAARSILARLAADIYEDRGETPPDFIDTNNDGIDDLYGGPINNEILQYTSRDGFLQVDRDGQTVLAFNADPESRLNQFAFGRSLIGEPNGSDIMEHDLDQLNSEEGQAQLMSNWLHGHDSDFGEQGTFYQPGNLAFFATNVYEGDLSQWFGEGATDNMVSMTELIERLDPDVRADFNQAMTSYLAQCNVSVEHWEGGNNYASAYYRPELDEDGNIAGARLVQQAVVQGQTQLVMRVTGPDGREQLITIRCGGQPMFPNDPYIPPVDEDEP
ncbi:hypothetical protein FWG76_01095, partial [Candidatus Saccharibacteria bacterium]|nr:hypothetical protein [Candidatus Saccharibacteria bacterium]